MVCSTQPVPMCPLPLPSSQNARHLATPAHHHPFQKPPLISLGFLAIFLPPSLPQTQHRLCAYFYCFRKRSDTVQSLL